jgi:2,3-bisphosphoglycerate-independent phosphoglycerate mutase
MNRSRPKPLLLMIRDGWGLSPSPRALAEKEGNAVLLARTPVQDRLLARYPCSLLTTSGEAVGLPAGQMGNSEVGHQNLGAGRIVYQDLTRISRAIADKSFFKIPAFLELLTQLKNQRGRLHLMGLCSAGGVHSHVDHLLALLDLAKQAGIQQVFVHCFTDGRDTSPTSGAETLAVIQAHTAKLGVGRIASIVGRYFAMDRDKRWDRTARAYHLLVDGVGETKGEPRADPAAALREWYAAGKTDEFIPPTVISQPGLPVQEQRLRKGDGIIFFNFRADRARQLTRSLADRAFRDFERTNHPEVRLVCMTNYDKTYSLPVAFPKEHFKSTFAEIVAGQGLRQLRIAETEKYAHVTLFFNVDVEKESPVAGEDRCLIPSPKDVPTYDFKPEMSAREVTAELLTRLRSGAYDVVILNYANADMVGHTGSIPAAVKAVETVDECSGQVLDVLLAMGGAALVTADHGNAERMLDEDGKPYTAHTTYPVQLFYVAQDAGRWKLRDGILADVAPTMLEVLGLPIPSEMTGKSLLEKA